ncbi:MAG: thiamine-phosphate kinase [Thermoanaerobaculia bacterium]
MARIRAAFPPAGAVVGIGDDAAVLAPRGRIVVTTDLLLEGVDFTAAVPLGFVAEKSLAANLSDLAAMGARPRWFVLSIGCPRERLRELETFVDALARASGRWRVGLVGGDLSSARDLTISIAAIGELDESVDPLLRSGGHAGDAVFVSRPLGGAAAGLHLLRRGWTIDAAGAVRPPADLPVTPGFAQKEFAQSALRRQVAPEPESDLGVALAAGRLATACIDVSDGLSTDLHRLCEASGCGAVVEWERVPRFPDIEGAGFSVGVVDPERAVLHGGEEFALLFTSSRREGELSSMLGRPIYRIGRLTTDAGVRLVRDGVEGELAAEGFDHFGNTK